MAHESLLVANMSVEAGRMEQFPVLIGDEIAYFHSIEGEYDERNQEHVVNFIHEVQGVGSPNHIDPDQASHNFEPHLDNFYNLDVSAVTVEDTYPDSDYVLSVRVEDYMSGEFSFSEELTADIDNRETRYE